jgi:hypothetical protein
MVYHGGKALDYYSGDSWFECLSGHDFRGILSPSRQMPG